MEGIWLDDLLYLNGMYWGSENEASEAIDENNAARIIQ